MQRQIVWWLLGALWCGARACQLAVEFNAEYFRLELPATDEEVLKFVADMTHGSVELLGNGCGDIECIAKTITESIEERLEECEIEASRNETERIAAASLRTSRTMPVSRQELEACRRADHGGFVEDLGDIDDIIRGLDDAIDGLKREGHSGDFREQQMLYAHLSRLPCVRRVCEIGFNAGHSAAIWLQNPLVEVIFFDLFQHSAGPIAEEYLRRNIEGADQRLKIVKGSSVNAVPAADALEASCDLLVVDGGHAREVARADIENFKRLANKDFHLLVVDDVYCDSYCCLGPTRAVDDTQKAGIISEDPIKTVQLFDDDDDDKKFVVRGMAVFEYRLS